MQGKKKQNCLQVPNTFPGRKKKACEKASAPLTERQTYSHHPGEETQIFQMDWFGIHFNHWACSGHNLGLMALKRPVSSCLWVP